MARTKQEIADDIYDRVNGLNFVISEGRAAGLEVEVGNRSLPVREVVVTISEPPVEAKKFERSKKEPKA